MKIKKTTLVVAVCLALAATTTFSAFAIAGYVKEKNPYQLAADKGIPISEVDKEGDFKYTEFDSDTEFEKDIDMSTEITGEKFTDPKTSIYNKMLNSIDYFNEVELTLETSMLGDKIATIHYQTNIDKGSAYESVTENGVITSETYSKPNNDYLTFVDNSAKNYNQQYLASFERSDTPYIPLADRIYTAEDGIPCFVYRRNITNCPLASYALVPQEITFSYLKNFDNWEIVDDKTAYLGRNCIKIEGKTTPYVAAKHNGDAFTMLVDAETGILMKFECLKDGNATNYITVTDCSFGRTKSAIKQFDVNQYSSYAETY